MLHFSCDICGKTLAAGSRHRYVVKMEAFPAIHPAELTDEDTDVDQVEEMAQLLSEQEESGDELPAFAACKKMRFDMCSFCFRKFAADPLGRDSLSLKFDFSEN